MSTRTDALARLGFQDLECLCREVEALAEMDAMARSALGDIRHAGAELRGALAGIRPAMRELETQVDMATGPGSAAPPADAPFDVLEMDRYSPLHEACREISDQTSDLHGLQSLIDASRAALESSLRQRAARIDALRAAVHRIGPRDLDGMLASVRERIREFADAHGVAMTFEADVITVDMTPASLASAGALIGAVGRLAVLEAVDAGAAVVLELSFSHAPAELAVEVCARDATSGASLFDSVAGSAGSDAVRQAAQALPRLARRAGARVLVRDDAIRIHLPLDGGEQPVLLVGVAEWVVGLHMPQLQAVVRLVDVTHDTDGAAIVLDGGDRVPALDLGEVCTDAAPAREPGPRRYAALVTAPRGRTALLFDRIEGSARTRLLPLAEPLRRACAALGASVTGDGRVVMVIDADRIADRPSGHTPPATRALDTVPRIMVVDDSVTIRKVSERMLTRNGLDVQAARDGREALEQIPVSPPDLILLDIEMPRMNGFQFLEALRADSALAAIPVIMISSRSGEKHRQQARSLGVEVFLGKPFKERELMAAIKDMLGWQS